MASSLSSGLPERVVLPQRLASYAVKSDCALGRAVPLNESLLSHFERPLCTNLHLGITVRVAMALEVSGRAQSEGLSYAMWVLSGFLAFVRLQDFTPADLIFSTTCDGSFHVPCPSGAGVRLPYCLPCHPRCEFYLSHLPAYLALSLSDRCSLPLRFLRIPSFLRRTFLVSSRRLGLCLPSSRNRPWLL